MHSPSGRRFHILVEGLVQGVGYRRWVTQEALSRGLGGWVRNRRTGAVEALFIGPTDAVVDMVEACRCGPTACRVDGLYTIEEADCSVEVAMAGFEVRDTV